MKNFFKLGRRNKSVLSYVFFDTALGETAAAASERGVCRLQFGVAGSNDAVVEGLREAWPDHTVRKAPRAFTELRRQIEAYLLGELQQFTVALDPQGTDFRKMVWEQVGKVPYGSTITYGELAGRLGRDRSASRAVGNALGANPLPVLIPCHRVLGRDGRLTGYGGGLELKTRLLRIEGALLL